MEKEKFKKGGFVKRYRIAEQFGKFNIEIEHDYNHPIWWWKTDRIWSTVNVLGWAYSGSQYFIPALKQFDSLKGAEYALNEFKKGKTYHYQTEEQDIDMDFDDPIVKE